MEQKITSFEIRLEGTVCRVEPGLTEPKICRPRSDEASYIIARHFFKNWVELTTAPGSPNIALELAGMQIENHYKELCDRE